MAMKISGFLKNTEPVGRKRVRGAASKNANGSKLVAQGFAFELNDSAAPNMLAKHKNGPFTKPK